MRNISRAGFDGILLGMPTTAAWAEDLGCSDFGQRRRLHGDQQRIGLRDSVLLVDTDEIGLAGKPRPMSWIGSSKHPRI